MPLYINTWIGFTLIINQAFGQHPNVLSKIPFLESLLSKPPTFQGFPLKLQSQVGSLLSKPPTIPGFEVPLKNLQSQVGNMGLPETVQTLLLLQGRLNDILENSTPIKAAPDSIKADQGKRSSPSAICGEWMHSVAGLPSSNPPCLGKFQPLQQVVLQTSR